MPYPQSRKYLIGKQTIFISMTGNVKRNSCPQSGKSLVNKLTNFMSAK